MFKKLICIFLLLYSYASFAQNVQYGNNNLALLPSAAQTGATIVSPDQNNLFFRGGHFIINVTAYTSGTYTPHIQGKDPISGTYYDILVGTAISATGITIIKVYPGIGASVNAASPDILPQLWRVELIGATSPSMTISFSAMLDQ